MTWPGREEVMGKRTRVYQVAHTFGHLHTCITGKNFTPLNVLFNLLYCFRHVNTLSMVLTPPENLKQSYLKMVFSTSFLSYSKMDNTIIKEFH